MTAQYQSVESNSNNVGGTVVVNRPSGTVDGDLLLAFVANLNPGSTYTPAPGWTLKAGTTSSDAIYERIASSEPATSTWTPGALAGLKVTIVRVNNQAASSPTAATSILPSASGTSFVIPSLTSPGANHLLLQVVNSGGSGTANFWTPPGTATERFDYLDAGLVYSAGGGDEVVGNGATGTRTWTAAAAGNAAGYMVAIAPGTLTGTQAIATTDTISQTGAAAAPQSVPTTVTIAQTPAAAGTQSVTTTDTISQTGAAASTQTVATTVGISQTGRATGTQSMATTATIAQDGIVTGVGIPSDYAPLIMDAFGLVRELEANENLLIKSSGGFTPTELQDAETFTVPDRRQALQAAPMLMGAGSMIELGDSSMLIGVD